MEQYDVFGKVIEKEKPNYKYFVYINTNLDVFGLDDLSEEKLQQVVDAFDLGKEAFFVSGRRYFFHEPLEFRIFKIDVNKYPSFSMEIESNNGFDKAFYTPQYLAKIGKEVTDNYLRGDYGWKNETRSSLNPLFEQFVPLGEISDGIEKINKIQEFASSNKIFIVHGHDESAKFEVARFIEKLGLEAIILHEQVNQGQTIIEKIESFSDVGYAIILYTPCDKGGFNQDNSLLKPRARQNVVFEHGYFTAKLGRNRVMSLVKDEIETPGDLSGVVYTQMDNNGAWKLKIVQELKALGYKIDLNHIF